MQCPQTPLRLLLSSFMLAIVACAAPGPPVQEMSDARQAIAAAREAGAVTYASEGLRSAEAQLAEAEAQLHEHLYWNAKRLALDAKASAVDALLRSRSLRETGATAAPETPPP